MGQVITLGGNVMSITIRLARLLWAWPLVLGSVLFISPVQAQQDTVLDDDEVVEEITVTGSRIKRDEFSSPSPIQVLDVGAGRQLGISSISELLNRASVISGTAIDASLNSSAGNFNATEGPPTGGVGSTNVDLRGLGPERTLILMNGRRLGSTGVRGAPAQPDIALIPFAMVERVEVLTEAVSAVYGADAVAGVVNVILRDEFEGIEVLVNAEQPDDPGGEITQVSMIMGLKGDRGSFQFAAEMFDRKRVRTGDRDFSRCFSNVEQFESDGRIVRICRDSFFDNNGFLPDFSLAFYTPGSTNIGVPNWSDETGIPSAPPEIIDGSTRWLYNDFYNDQDERRNSDLVSNIERFSIVATGKLAVDWWANEEVYFEAMYLNSQLFSKAITEQIFPDILGLIPQEDINGNIIVEPLNLFWATDQNDPNEFLDTAMTIPNPDFGMCDPTASPTPIGAGDYPCAGVLMTAAGTAILVDNPLNPFPTDFTPILTIESIPQHRTIEREAFRYVVGLRGDFGDSSWSYDGFVSYDRGIGFQSQPVLFEPNLELSLYTLRLDVNGNPICGVAGNNSSIGFGFTTADTCVPLDLNNADLYIGGPSGQGILSPAEQAFLVGNRTNRTVVEQSIISAFATGDLYEFAGRTIAAAVGFEYRKDEINSQNDIVGVQGLNAAESPLQEGETVGSRDLFEVFGEINVPIFDNLDFDGALRYTDEENFGSEVTWRARVAWVATDWLTLSGTHGTSFRAPNLREQFLADQFGGLSGSLDPCIFSNIAALVVLSGGDQGADVELVINNCIADGVTIIDTDGNGFPDSSLLGFGGVVTIPKVSGGNQQLLAETSETDTFTVKFTQPWTDAFDLDLAISYWDISIKDTVAEPQPEFIIGGCYGDLNFPNLTSPFCTLITRSGGAAASNFISALNVSFVNIGEETARGIDINTRINYTFEGLGVDASWVTATTKLLEQEIETFDPADRDDNLGEIGTPEWKFTSTLSLIRGDWEFLMQNRYIGDAQNDNTEDFLVATGRRADWTSLEATRRVNWVEETWYTDVSVSYLQDVWSVTLGINNVADESPPIVDSLVGGPNRNSATSSAGYDFFGRTWFMTAAVSF